MSKSKTNKKEVKKQDLLYIMSPQCGWCKKASPVVDELIKDGAKITTVDITTPEGQTRANEVKQKHNAQCGTPLFIDNESGNMKCGFAEKDVLEKWVAGEEIPKPPQPKSPPPPPPADLESASDDEVKAWKAGYEKWTGENKHLPNLLPFEQILDRVKQAQVARKNAPQGAPGQPGSPVTAGVSNIPSDHSFNNEFYYVVLNGKKEVVMADSKYIQSLQHQYFQREDGGRLTKVVGDTSFNKMPSNGAPIQPRLTAPNRPVTAPPNVKKQADKKLEDVERQRKVNTKTKEVKSKKNKKTIESF